jgi:hypothetical protein
MNGPGVVRDRTEDVKSLECHLLMIKTCTWLAFESNCPVLVTVFYL